MKRTGRHRNGIHAKQRRARIARRLKLIDERRSVAIFISELERIEKKAFARFYRPFLSPEQIEEQSGVLSFVIQFFFGAVHVFVLVFRFVEIEQWIRRAPAIHRNLAGMPGITIGIRRRIIPVENLAFKFLV